MMRFVRAIAFLLVLPTALPAQTEDASRLVAALLGKDEMAEMDGIERAAENADAHDLPRPAAAVGVDAQDDLDFPVLGVVRQRLPVRNDADALVDQLKAALGLTHRLDRK